MMGFNEPLMTVQYLIAGIQPTYKIRMGTILRYWQELYVGNDRISAVEENGRLIGDGSQL
jgi:hypothetical protein